jgi:hypothetical protein
MTIETELPAVKVKALEWNAEPPYHVARGNGGGHYSIERVDSRVVYFELRGNSIWPIKKFASMTEAKAAAQADYERRILSALVLKDDPGNGASMR